MGSALSPLLSNIFVDALESKVVEKYIKLGRVIHYSRFADDSLIILHKNSVRSFIKDINNFDKLLKYTTVDMNQKNEINFLDLTVYINDQNSFRKLRKKLSKYGHI